LLYVRGGGYQQKNAELAPGFCIFQQIIQLLKLCTISQDGAYAPKDKDGNYNIWYHAGANGNLPTDIYHATSSDLINWSVTPNTPVLSHRGTGAGFAFDQVADPSPLTVGNLAYIACKHPDATVSPVTFRFLDLLIEGCLRFVDDGDDNRAGATQHAAIGMGVASLV